MFTGKVGYWTVFCIFLCAEMGPDFRTGLSADAGPDIRIFCGKENKIGYYFTAYVAEKMKSED